MEKKTVIDEIFSQARIYLDEEVNMSINIIREEDPIPDACSTCNNELVEIYSRPVRMMQSCYDYDLVVLKCEKCLRVYAFCIEPSAYDDSFLIPTREDEQLGGRIVEPRQWKHVGKPQWGEGEIPTFSERIAKAYSKEILSENPRSKLDQIIQRKLTEMYQGGLSIETINLARIKMVNYLRKNRAKTLTLKQNVSLIAAAIYEASNEKLNGVSRLGRIEEKITERQLERMFGVTRKTIRKWKSKLQACMNLPICDCSALHRKIVQQ